LIELNGANAGTNGLFGAPVDGLYLTGSNCTVSGLIIEGFSYNGIEVAGSNNTIGGTSAGAGNVLSGNVYFGVAIDGGVSGVQVQGNFIGTDAYGNSGSFATSPLPNGQGIVVNGPNNTIGGTVAGARNIISGNTGNGLRIASSGVVVEGNYIGTNPSGSGALGNGNVGIVVASSNNTIGGTVAGAENVISGNNVDGVYIGAGVSGVQVQGNEIGTDYSGTSALGNGVNGVEVAGSNNTVGGTTAADRNLISGGYHNGLVIDSGATGVQVQGNYIGTDVTGTSAVGNGNIGVEVLSSNNTLGGTTPRAGNIISDNSNGDGVYIDTNVSGVQVQGNYIGTDVTGSNRLGNSIGIEAAGSNDTIGGTSNGAGNLLSGNGIYGVLIDSGASGVAVQGNSIGTNAAGTAAVANFDGVNVESSNNFIGGTTSADRNIIFGNSTDGILITASGVSVVGNYVGTNAAGTAAVGNGAAGVAVEASRDTIGGVKTGTSNLLSGNLYGIVIIPGSSGVVVQGNSIGTNAAGTAAVGNRTGIDVAGSNDTIGSSSGIGGNIISGNSLDGLFFSGSGSTVQGNYIGTDVTGNVALANGIGVEVSAADNTIGGTTTGARNVISGNSGDGILLDNAASATVVQGNYIGLKAGGTALGNSGNGLEIAGTGNTIGGTVSAAANAIYNNTLDGILLDKSAGGNVVQANNLLSNFQNGLEIAGSGNTIGGSSGVLRNLLDNNAADGVLLDASASGNQVLGNFLGLSGTGTSAQANGTNGIEVQGTNNTIGGTTAGARNFISGNGNDGVLLNSGASGNVVQGNFIGTNTTGTSSVANSVNGVEVLGSGNTIGGTTSAARNFISGNTNDGVTLGTSASGNLVQGNYIGTSNTGMAALANSGNGVEVLGSINTLGGTTVGARNIIAGNLLDGVLLNTCGSGNVVQNNFVGLSSAGTSALTNSGNGVEVLGNNDTIGGTTSAARNIIAGNLLDGVLLGSGSSGNQVQGNFMGVMSGGTAAQANSGNGVEVLGTNNTVGGSVAGARNLISGNAQDGVLVDSGATGSQVQGNYIGTTANGSAALANSGNGVELYGSNDTIGGSTAAARNVISGNANDGVFIDSGASGVAVQGNYLGTDATGKLKLGNSANGVEVASNNALIGGSSVALRNVISGNMGAGVLIDGGVSGTRVQGNFIGSDMTGSVSLANALGVEVAGSGNTIGGVSIAARNVIAGNAVNGVQIDAGANGNAVQGNYIGVNLTASSALANSGYGVSIAGSYNMIGGTALGASNTVADNSQGGVLVSAGSGDSIRHNLLYANGGSQHGPGIVLAAGANNNLAAPILNTATLSGSTLTVTGTFTAPTANVPYVLEFYASPAGDGEGKAYLGSRTVTPASAGTVSFTFTTTTSSANSTTLITVTLTDASGSTSAFSAGVTS
jgi:hypothetical protein